jgi:two-component system CheB/CheR fusion protein
MKKPNSPKTAKRKTKNPSKPAEGSKRAKSVTGGAVINLTAAAKASVKGAKELYGAADSLHHKAEALHQTIHEVRHNIEAPELVIDENDGKAAKPFPIVGIGASAGGYEAFTEFLASLSKDTGMAFVLVQHLDPKHKSKLTELLVHSTKIPVREATDGLEVEPNNIYVIPENTNMTIQSGCLRLSPRRMHEAPPMPIDLFFRSLASQQQERAIGIVLSGTGSDGSLGLEAIKGESGITFAQDENSAKYFGMPGSAIASGSVDFVMTPGEIAKELGRIARHPYVGRPAKPQSQKTGGVVDTERLIREYPDELARLFNHLRSRTGVDFAFYKQSTLKRRIIRRMVLHKLDNLEAYVRMVENTPPELDALFNDLLINVTNFFRDPSSFQILKRKIFPRMLKAHANDSPLRVWVCGCATGEEAYSLAISLVEYFEQNRSHRLVQIFATDISDASIEKARAGIYPENIQQDVSPERLRRFFTKVNGNFQVHKSIRDMCIFARQNVVVDPPFSNLDLVTCRNVLIYFGPALQRRLIPLFHYALRPNGFLLLGTSETIGASAEHFSLVDKKHKIYVKKVSFLRPGFEIARRAQLPEGQNASPVHVADQTREGKPLDIQQHVDKILLREFSPGAVVTNGDFEVVHFRGRTGDYLEHAPGQASLSLLKMVRESLVIGLRAVLNRASKTDEPARQTGIELRQNRHVRELTLEVVPFKMGPTQERFFLVVFYENHVPATPQVESGSVPAGPRGRDRREILKLHEELNTTKESLQSIIEEQEATNEELKSANEEIQSSNEELQSTNEELETAKEELQSTNEELTTLNEELQNRNTELSQANNDLTNLLASVHVPILMLGNDLTIRRFTPMAERLFNLIPADVGRRLSDLSRAILVPDLDASVREVIDNLTPIEREAQDREGHWFLLRIRPYRTRENRIEGAVIVLVDIDELRHAVDVLMGMVKECLVVLDRDMKVRKASQAFYDAFQLQPEQVEGKSFSVLGEGWNASNLRSLLEEVLPKNKKISNFEFEATLPKIGWRRMRVNAGRFFAEGRNADLILMAVEDLTGKD